MQAIPERGRVLVVDDEAATARAIADVLSDAGYSTQIVTDPREAVRLVQEFRPDLVTLDVVMPRLDGVSTCLAIRDSSSVPILFLSARAGAADRVVGLRIGADDYLAKPFDADELVARVEAILRRSAQRRSRDTELRIGDIVLDRLAMQVRHDDQILPITPSEFSLLTTLAAAPGKVFERSQLLDDPSHYERGGDTRAIDVRIGRLRRKLEEAHVSAVALETVRGFGYRLSPITTEADSPEMAAD